MFSGYYKVFLGILILFLELVESFPCKTFSLASMSERAFDQTYITKEKFNSRV